MQDEWLAAELQKVVNRLAKRRFKDCLYKSAAPTVSISHRMTHVGGKYTHEDLDIRISWLFHRDHGMDATLVVLKHELAHWAAMLRWGAAVRVHGQEWADIAYKLDPRSAKPYCNAFAFYERRK